MTEDQAKAEATKREKNKSKHMVNKQWRAVHTEEKGWHVALVDNPKHVLEEGMQQARDLFAQGGTWKEFEDISSKILQAHCQIAIDQFKAGEV